MKKYFQSSFPYLCIPDLHKEQFHNVIHPVFLYHGKDIIAVSDNRDPLKNSAQFVGIIIYEIGRAHV